MRKSISGTMLTTMISAETSRPLRRFPAVGGRCASIGAPSLPDENRVSISSAQGTRNRGAMPRSPRKQEGMPDFSMMSDRRQCFRSEAAIIIGKLRGSSVVVNRVSVWCYPFTTGEQYRLAIQTPVSYATFHPEYRFLAMRATDRANERPD